MANIEAVPGSAPSLFEVMTPTQIAGSPISTTFTFETNYIPTPAPSEGSMLSPEAKRLIDKLPLTNIPITSLMFSEDSDSSEDQYVALHEFAHAWETLREGEYVIGIDLNPNPFDGSLARTYVSRVTPTIAAASGVIGDFGTDGDKSVVDWFGSSWASAVDATRSNWNKLGGDPVISKIGRILRYIHDHDHTNIPGTMIHDIVVRAQLEHELELQLEKDGVSINDINFDEYSIGYWESVWSDAVEASHVLPDEYKKESLYPQGDRIIETIHEGVVIETHVICGICKGKDGAHYELKHREYEARQNWVTTTTADVNPIQPRGVLVDRNLGEPTLGQNNNLLTPFINPVTATIV